MNNWPLTMAFTCATCGAPSGGLSRESVYVSTAIEGIRGRLQDSRSVGMQAAFDDLESLASEASVRGWNGYDGLPIDSGSRRHAEKFLRSLGIGFRHPSLGVSGEGWVTMQWARSASWTLSLLFSSDGWIHWAMLFGTERRSGTSAFLGAVPRDLQTLIDRASNP